MFDLYTSCFISGNMILYRGYDHNDRRISRKIPYKPYVFINSKKQDSEYKSFSRNPKPLDKLEFDTIREAKDFVKKYEDVDGFEIHGLTNFLYPFINHSFPKEIEYGKHKLSIGIIDIEVDSEDHYASVENPDQEVISISIKHSYQNKFKKIVLGLHPWNTCPEKVKYIQCKNENELLMKFLSIWEEMDLDIVTGWYSDSFDIPYIVNRMNRVLGEDETKRLSPWRMIHEDTRSDKLGRTTKIYNLIGIEQLDYLRLFQKFTYSAQESYTLDYILSVLKLESKIKYTGSLADLYRTDKDMFYTYNLRDVDAVSDIDEKTNLLDQALTLAYDARIPFQDVFGTVKMWDQIVHCALIEKKIVPPPFERSGGKNAQFEGAYVKTPIIGRHKYIVSVDYEALYPSIAIWGNFSNETYRGKLPNYYSIDDLINKGLSEEDRKFLKDNNLCLGANMTLWDKSEIGIFPEIFLRLKLDRKQYKKKYLGAKTELESVDKNDQELRREIDFKITRFNNLQASKKIQNNSGYGGIGNIWFRYFFLDFAEGITLSGQLADRWVEAKLNQYLNKIFKTENYEYVLYADTDSLYLTLEPIVNQVMPNETDQKKIINFMDKLVEDKIQPFINKSIQELSEMMNAKDASSLVMKREALSDVGIWVGKKNYALSVYDNEGVKYNEPDLKIMGMAAVKSSTPKFCREKIKEAIKIMLYKEKQDLIDFVDTVRKEFYSLPYQDIASPIGCNGIKKYHDPKMIYKSGCPGHVKGALIFNDLLRKRKLDKNIQAIKEGDKIKYIFLKSPNPLMQDVISFSGIPPKEIEDVLAYSDKEKAFEKGIISPIKAVADVIGWETEHRSTLADFF